MPTRGDEMIHRIESLSAQIFRALDCKGVVRIDYMLTKNDELYITEINTIPGSMAFSYLAGKRRILPAADR
ncbi:MAG: hypothetical protein V8Q82_09230 [Christensenellales bacterium]